MAGNLCSYCGQEMSGIMDSINGHGCKEERAFMEASERRKNACSRCGSQLVKAANGGLVCPKRRTPPRSYDSRMRLECLPAR